MVPLRRRLWGLISGDSPGFDDKILSLYARGMTTREIQGHLQEVYGAEVSPSLVSTVTEGVVEEVKQWQSRPLEPLYPILFLDALMVKMRHDGRVENRAVYVAVGLDLDGRKDVLGLWTSAPFKTQSCESSQLPGRRPRQSPKSGHRT